MSSERKEIEVKATLSDLNGFCSQLRKLGVELSDPITQNDVTFVDANYGAYDKFQAGKNILRIREHNGTYLFTLKQAQHNELDCIEYETEIADPKEFVEALHLMGYKQVVEIHKVRRKAKYKEYEICVDEVQELGSFVEVEKITDSENADAVQETLFNFLESLGVPREARVTRGYDTMVYLKQKAGLASVPGRQ